MTSFAKALMGQGPMEDAINSEVLKYAVQRQIFCKRTDKVLDIRSAVLIRVVNKVSGASASEVVDGSWWDGEDGRALFNLCESNSDLDLEVIDGRKLNMK